MEYVRVCRTKEAKGFLIPTDDDVQKYVKDRECDWYKSLYYYNQDHYDDFRRFGTIKGIKDVTSPYLVWDFDSKTDVELARLDTISLVDRLNEFGVKSHDIRLYFSGMKGFMVELETNRRFTPEEMKAVTLSVAKGLLTCDPGVTNASRLFRISRTKHQGSGLYKIPITEAQLHMPLEKIRELASTLDNLIVEEGDYKSMALPEAIDKLRHESKQVMASIPAAFTKIEDLDFSHKPKGIPNCKYALMNGYFRDGERSKACMALAATFRAQGIPKELTYGMLKSAVRISHSRFKGELFSKEEIWNTVISQVYSEDWGGGQYSCKNEPFLTAICNSLGEHKCGEVNEEISVVGLSTLAGRFQKYIQNIDKNTIKTGIDAMDDNVQLTIGMPVAVLGSPGSGKTTLVIDMLRNTSMAGVPSVFFSMDMYDSLVYAKMLQKELGIDFRKIQEQYVSDRSVIERAEARIAEEYKNVAFSTKSNQTVSDLRKAITDHQERLGNKVKLVVVDYLECLAGPGGDLTTISQKIAGELKDLAVDMDVCLVVLVQPQKSAGDPREPISSMRQIKGSSMLEQSFRVVFGIWREGFSQATPENDQFITIAALKNTMGSPKSVDCAWDGLRGSITPLTPEGFRKLKVLRDQIEQKKASAAPPSAFASRASKY